jgi:lipooligosaccharide transport system ATP-binding protein
LETVVEARNLTKKFDSNSAVDKVNLSVRAGESFGLLGPGGAGKTALLRMMYGLSPITSGELFVLGLNMRDHSLDIKRQIGVVPQDEGLDLDFSVLDNLLIFGRYFMMPDSVVRSKAKRLLRMMHLEDFADRSTESIGTGLRRRLAIARALLNDPKVIFLDEPTVGLDPHARYWIWETLQRLKADGVTIVLSTSSMHEAQSVCDRVAILDRGRVLIEGAPVGIVREHIGKEVVEFRVPQSELTYFVNKIKNRFEFQVLNEKIRVFIGEGQDGRQAMNELFSDDIRIRPASLDDVFLKLTGQELRLNEVSP